MAKKCIIFSPFMLIISIFIIFIFIVELNEMAFTIMILDTDLLNQDFLGALKSIKRHQLNSLTSP